MYEKKMLDNGEFEQRPKIEYPCEWEYKIIGENIDEILSAIESASLGLEYTVSPSNMSRNGKYCSLNLKLVVPNEVVRDLVYEKLSSNDFVRFVI
jgi:putative lipoic acid-binding regulatory protein